MNYFSIYSTIISRTTCVALSLKHKLEATTKLLLEFRRAHYLGTTELRVVAAGPAALPKSLLYQGGAGMRTRRE